MPRYHWPRRSATLRASGRRPRDGRHTLWSFPAISRCLLSLRQRSLKKQGNHEMPKQKIRIKLKGFDHKLIDQAAEQIVEAVERTGAVVSGPVPLPTHIQRWRVIRSPFIDQRSQEQVEIRTHKRLIDIMETSSKTIDALTSLNLPAGVEIDIKL